MKTLKVLPILQAVLVLFTSGCASIVSDWEWPVTFRSNPSGAYVILRDKDGVEIHRGYTPITIKLDASSGYFSGAEYEVEMRLPGYEVSKGRVSARLNGWYVGNVVFGGLIGLLILDPVTGAMFKLPPEYTASLTKCTALSSNECGLGVITLSEVPSELKGKLIRVK